METPPLKSFATWARKELIREVAARIAVVLAPASPERVEQPKAVEALEKAVTAGGGGDKGRAAVADKVAYTWFNRIIALRFMDANGYTGVGVISPQAGVETGQPEILAEAKRGNIDTGVVAGKTRETVTSLLNGTRRSDDAQGEAYALLLADYCRHWNRAMPFMFEREGDFTELLIPGNLLADDSVSSRAVKVLTKDVCQDVEVIGWLYQFYISERKDEVFAGFKKNKKAGADEIPAATQLFTPHWIVRYLVENSLGRLWMLNRPTSHLVDQMDYYIAPIDEETEFLKISRPEGLKIVDPACGSGHMLTYAFDLLYAIYEEEGYAPADIPSLILTNNLYGIEIDPRAGALAAFALTMKARAKQRTFFNKQIEPNVCVLDPISFTPDEIDSLLTRGGDKAAETGFWNQFEHADTFGSLIQPDHEMTIRLKEHIAKLDDGGDILLAEVLDWAERVIEQAEFLSRGYVVVVANPPYMNSGNMSALLSDMAKDEYPRSKANLYAMFIERCFALGADCCHVAMITMESWMFLGSYVALRASMRRSRTVLSMVHLGSGAFDSISGEVVATSAFVAKKLPTPGHVGTYIRLVEEPDESAKALALQTVVLDSRNPRRYAVNAREFETIPDGICAYWLQEAAIHAFAMGTVGDHARSEGAVKTGDNARFLRKVWEVNRREIGPTGRWRLHPKGGGFRQWYGNVDTVVDWSSGARDHYRKDRIARIPAAEYWDLTGITWSSVSTARASFRVLNADEIANNAALFIFLNNQERTLPVLGYLNSRYAAEYLEAIAPTINYLVGDVMSLPLPSEFVEEQTLGSNVAALVDAARADWDESETSASFCSLPLLSQHAALVEEAAADVDRLRGERSRLARQLAAANEKILSLTFGHTAAPIAHAGDGGSSAAADTKVDQTRDLVSYAIGCMFGRYSLEEPGLILADQGATVQDYLAKLPNPTFAPDKDNVIPIVDGDWFEDDVVARFRTFLRVAFGEQHFEENLRFVTESLGVRDVRDYFVKSFYKDHVQRYKKRPIYWLFSSPKGSFNALIYLHRYTPSTVSTVLNEYLREFTAKLSSSLQQQERLAAGGGAPRQQAAAQKEADRLRKVLLELEEYEHDVLYPLASRQLAIDLDDGVKANYPKFGAALKKIPGLEASDE